MYSTYLGGPDDDGAYGLAVDSLGNAYVAGSVQVAAGFGFDTSAKGFGIFVSKLDPQGTLVYSFFHPYGSFAGIAAAAAIAVDGAGSAYVTGTASSSDPSTATKTFGPPGAAQALVFKLAPDGSREVYETTLGGSVQADGTAITVDRTGAAYVAGITTSVDFPLVHPLQSTMGARPLWKSTDSGASWTPLEDPPFAFAQALVVDPTALNSLYVTTTDAGIFKSPDGGASWNPANHGIAGATQVLSIDPRHPQTLYAATGSGATPGVVYKSVDGANTWSAVDSSASAQALQVAVGPQNPSSVYVRWNNGTRRSIDGGTTWSGVTFPRTLMNSLALDPRVSGNLFAISTDKPGIPSAFGGGYGTPGDILRSTDGGSNWVWLTSLGSLGSTGTLTVDGSTNPSTLYLNEGYITGFRRSVDGGATWTTLSPPSGFSAVAVDPAGTLYGVANNEMFTSRDRGQTWTATGSPVPFSSGVKILATAPGGSAGTLYAVVQNPQNSGFVTKLSPDGQSIVFSTFLHGHVSLAADMAPGSFPAGAPGVFETQNWISAIALDPAGNVVVAGGTRASDFPLANPVQSFNAGRADAFAATLSADGKLTSSTYFGGSNDDSALAVAADAQGNVILAGETVSNDFPVQGGVLPPAGQSGHAFVTKLAPSAPPAISSVLNGASLRPGIEAGSWVTIKGTNLANTSPGRAWRNDEIVNGNLPTSLNGVSVTIDGKPAFVEYISPTQINVQAPSDTATGAVNVLVDNNGAVSAPATVQLQAAAPAFFMYSGTSDAIASRWPDNALVGDPTMVAGTVAAKPGDVLVLWGTGFGATTPAVAAGTTVSGAPAVVTAPTVTVGGVAAQMLSAVLSPGNAGLYQMAIQLPANVPMGPVAVIASVGGVQTPAGVLLFVANP